MYIIYPFSITKEEGKIWAYFLIWSEESCCRVNNRIYFMHYICSILELTFSCFLINRELLDLRCETIFKLYITAHSRTGFS